MTPQPATADAVLTAAARIAGLDATGAAVIRDGSNVMYRLPGGVVARIGRDGTEANAARQIEVSRWLAVAGLSVVHALDDLLQLTMVNRRPVTWWELLPEHRPATTGELGAVLRSLHAHAPSRTRTAPVRPV